MIKIAIDGLTGSGKGTLADGIAKKFGLKHLDTGAIFRGIACGFVDLGIENLSEENVKNNIDKINVEVKFIDGVQKVFLEGKDITHLLRTEKISQTASKVSAFPVVREKYLKIVHAFADANDCIIDGRDITSVVLPDADVKIYLTADEKVRAERRYKENVEKHIDGTFEEVLANLQERDYRDTHRDVAPLIITDDAIVFDNTNITIEETIKQGCEMVEKILKEKGKV